jgi:hypothetical protein
MVVDAPYPLSALPLLQVTVDFDPSLRLCEQPNVSSLIVGVGEGGPALLAHRSLVLKRSYDLEAFELLVW